MAWDVTQGIVCIIYWYVQNAQSGIRHPNRLGLGCKEDRARATEAIKQIIDQDDYVGQYINLRYFRRESYQMQYCNTLFCLSGTISTSQLAKAEVDIFPLNLSNWNLLTRDETDQDEIDSWILDADESRRNDDPDSFALPGNICMFVFTPVGAIVVLVVSVIIAIKVYKKIYKKENDDELTALTSAANNGPVVMYEKSDSEQTCADAVN